MGSSGAAMLHSALRPKGSRELWCCPGETVYSVGVVSRRHTAAHQRADSGPSLPRTLPAAPRAPAGAWAAAGGAHEGGTPTTHPASPRAPALASMADLLEFLSARMGEAALHAALSLLLPLLRPDSARTTDAARAVLDHCEMQRAAGEDLPAPLEEVEALLRQHSAVWGDAAPAAAAGTSTTAAVPPAAGGPGAAAGAAANAPPGAGGIAAISLAELSRPRPGPRPWASGAHSGSCGSGSGASYSSGSLSSELSLTLSPVIPIGGGFVDGLQLPRTITPPCTNATERRAERQGGGGAGQGKASAHARRSPPAQGLPAQGGSSSSSSSLEGLLQVPRCVPASAGGRRRPKPNPDPDPNPSPNPEPSR